MISQSIASDMETCTGAQGPFRHRIPDIFIQVLNLIEFETLMLRFDKLCSFLVAHVSTEKTSTAFRHWIQPAFCVAGAS